MKRFKKINFNFSVHPTVSQKELSQYNFSSLDVVSLKRVARGSISVTCSESQEEILIESEVIDYLSQLRDVVHSVREKNFETFVISPDFYSNNLFFTYSPRTGYLEIREANAGDFKYEVKYTMFESELEKFICNATSELSAIYPGLSENKHFKEMLEWS